MSEIPTYYIRKNLPYIFGMKVIEEEDFVSLSHVHNEIEVIKVIENKIKITVLGAEETIQEGDIICIDSHVAHSVNAHKGSKYYYVRLKKQRLAEKGAIITSKYFDDFVTDRENTYSIIPCDSELNRRISVCLFEMESYEKDISEYASYLMETWSNIILGLLLENRMLSHARIPDKHVDKIKRVVGYIDSNFYQSITLDDISAVSKYSKYYINRLFKQLTNKSIADYVSYVRINAAENLIKKTNLSIGEITEAVGFSTMSGFCKAFKKTNDCTPGQYRERYAKSKNI